MLDRLKAHKRRLVHSFHPLVVKLLESFYDTIHRPVFFRLDRCGWIPSILGEMFTGLLREVIAERLQVTSPMRSIVCVNTKLILVAHNAVVRALHGCAVGVCRGIETRSKLHDFMDTVYMKLALKMCQAIEHLESALTVANVENFIDLGLFFDHIDVGDVVVNTHVSPCVHPVVVVQCCVKCFVLLGVSSATTVSDPHIITSVYQHQLKRFAFCEVGHPICTVLKITVLNQNSALTRRR